MAAPDVELMAMSSILEALQKLPDDESRTRCIDWAIARLGIKVGSTNPESSGRTGSARSPMGRRQTPTNGDLLDDIIEQNEDGRLRVIARDLKAKSKNDAALRLVYLVVFANEVLSGQQKTSSKKLVVPVLNDWRAYDGNTRWAISKDQGIKRDGDSLSLDIHSKREAQRYIAEIRDESVKGSWTPSGARSRKTANKATVKAAK